MTRRSEEEKAEIFRKIKELFDKGMSPVEVANAVGMSSSNIFKVVQSQGYRIAKTYHLAKIKKVRKKSTAKKKPAKKKKK